MNEMDLLNKVREAVQEQGCLSFRTNVGRVYMKDGRFFDTGLPKGFSDLLVICPGGHTAFIETKLHPRKPTKEQCKFMLAMISQGCKAGVAYTVDEALQIIDWDSDFATNMIGMLKKCST